jgi:hypothetical protein
MEKVIASLVQVLLIVAIFSNGYNVEGASRGNQHKKDDDIYKSQKFEQYNDADCLTLFLLCSVHYYLIPLFNQRCTPNYHTINYIAPNMSDAPQVERSLP